MHMQITENVNAHDCLLTITNYNRIYLKFLMHLHLFHERQIHRKESSTNFELILVFSNKFLSILFLNFSEK